MEIKILKAGSGDAIIIKHKGKNFLIDGGNESKHLINEINHISQSKEVIDLLVVTHHDDDHIQGVIDLITLVKENHYGDKNNFIKHILFNSPRKVIGKQIPTKDKLLSYKQAHYLEELLAEIKCNWTICTDQSNDINYEGLKIRFLSPSKEDIKEYSEDKGALLTSEFRCDWESSMSILEKHIDDKSQDISLYNKCSIVIQLSTDNKRILLTGDVTPKRLDEIITNLCVEENCDKIYFDLIKLPHHGSYRSINQRILEKINCQNYIISTNGKKHFLPNKRAILKILRFSTREQNEKINFIFNYQECISNLRITDQELKHYNIQLTPNNEKYGYVIR